MEADVQQIKIEPGPVPERNGAPAVAELGLLPALESGLGRAAALAATVGGTVGLLYVIGGSVMWLRFYKVGLPADQAVALMPKTDLLVVGLRVMVLPALAVGGLLLVLVSSWVRRRARIERLHVEKREKERRLREAAEPAGRFDRTSDPTPNEIHEEVRQLAERLEQEQPPTSIKDVLADRKQHPLRFWLVAGAAFATALVVPFSPGALAWPLGTAAIVGSWLHLRAESVRTPSHPVPVWRVAAVAVLAAAGISIARQTDPPVQLPVVQVTVSDPDAIPPNVFANSLRTSSGPDRTTTVSGVLVALTAKEIDVGDPITHSIASIPRAAASSIAVGTSVDRSSPPQSLASRFLFRGTAWAFTPLEFWCGNERYGWSRFWKICKGRSFVAESDRSAQSKRDGLVGLRVTCPADASTACNGYLRVTTVSSYPDAARRVTSPLTMPPAWFTVAKGDSGPVKVPVDPEKLWEQVSKGATSDTVEIDVRLRLSQDTAGKAVVYDGRGRITVHRPPAPKQENKDQAKEKEKQGDVPADADTGPKGGGVTVPKADATRTPTATPTPAEPTPTPDGTSPLQQQEPTQQVPVATPTVVP